MRRGFTLIEMLVVVSIISMLSSIVIASVAPIRALARDRARQQQINQIDTAVQLYQSKYGHVPLLQSGCAVQQQSVTDLNVVSGCVAISTQGVSASTLTAWQKFQSDIAEFIPTLPSDPCPLCLSPSGNSLGYVYVAPLAMQYYCQTNSCSASNSMYQLYAPLESSSSFSGSSNSQSTGFTSPPSSGNGPIPVIYDLNNSLISGDQQTGMYKVTPGGNISIEGYYLTGPLEVVLRNVFSFYEIRIPSDGASGTVGGNFDVAAPLDESQYIMTVVNANGTSNGMNIIILTE